MLQVLLNLTPTERLDHVTLAADVRFYACRGYTTFEKAAHEELALGSFTSGLTPERLREHLCIKALHQIQ